jgi:UDP-N-acetylmuramate--alanine ligase
MLDKKLTYHFIGIGGIGMSGLARILLSRGYTVSGSDNAESSITKELGDKGAKVFIGQSAENIKNADVVIYSAAIKPGNPELDEAKRLGLKLLRRSELLGLLMLEKKGIAIAGTHGKTTTSTMLGMILLDSGLDPAMAIGGEVKNIGGNAKDGEGEYFVAEACEYDRSFLDLHPYAAIITNIEEDHLDTYGDLSHILETFSQFLKQVDKDGFIVISAWDANIAKTLSHYSGKIIDYGFLEGEYQAKNVKVVKHTTLFDVFREEKKIGKIKMVVPGAHNILNALAVTACALEIGVGFSDISKSLEKFTGAKRRFEIKGDKDSVLVIDDYAHHPTEIQATLDGLKSYYPDSKIWCVFQAHQYSRTKYLLADFAQSFSKADQVLIPEIYEARDTEEDKRAVSGEILAGEIDKESHNAKYIGEFSEITKYLRENTKSGDIIITIGAGPVYKVGEEFLKE